jgi:hypothetical protein
VCVCVSGRNGDVVTSTSQTDMYMCMCVYMCVRVYMCVFVCVCVCVPHTCHQDEVLPDGAKGQLLECIQLYHKTALAEPEIHVRIRYD